MNMIALMALVLAAGGPLQHEHAAHGASALQVPAAIKADHVELQERLAEATKVPGEVGKAAEEVARALHAHFEAEEEYALPPLGALQPLAAGKVSSDLRPAIEKAAWLKANMSKMLGEHKTIVAALDKLAAAARAGNSPEQIKFVEALKQHAMLEEEVLYPAAILAGEMVEIRMKK